LAARQGHIRAEIALAYIYQSGQGVPRDDTVAVSWLQKGAEQGDAEAQNTLGACYFTGQGIKANDALAAWWFARAAEQGNRTAQENLAKLYQLGRGVTRDVKRAYKWRVLSLQGRDNAQSPELRDMAGAMNKSEIVEAEHAASDWRVVHQNMEPVQPNFALLQ